MPAFKVLAASAVLFSAPALACNLAWPDASIPVPQHVRLFINSECQEFSGWGEETVDECVSRETYGYRAVVTVLMDEELGERAAARYRGCAAGLGRLGGKFHRRKAQCISIALGIKWRFAYSRETSLPHIRKASPGVPRTPMQRQKALDYALSVIK